MEADRFTSRILARYLAGECSSQEQKDIEKWVRESSENAQKLEEFRRIWNASKGMGLNHKKIDTEGGWEILSRRFEQEEVAKGAEKEENRPQYKTTASIHSASQKIMRIAAILLIAGLAGFFAYQNFYQPEPAAKEIALREISTDKAQRVNLTLADGTKVLLNAESNIKLPAHFKQDIREVFLQGEAFFNVVNGEKPFIIHTENTVIRVLGTAFSVRSFPEDEQVQVVVQEGSVSFGPNNTGAAEKVTLNRNELGRYDLKNKTIETKGIDDIQLYLSWKEGYLKFRDTPMAKVAKELERRFGVEVKFKGADIENKLLTAFLKSRSIRNVLDVISVSLDISYTLKKDNVTFINS